MAGRGRAGLFEVSEQVTDELEMKTRSCDDDSTSATRTA